MKLTRLLTFFCIVWITFSCTHPSNESVTADDFFQNFVNPPAEARPFVRWWWNGNHITEDEIKRQLDVFQAAGIGGVEINPIAMPEEAVDVGTQPVEWLSTEWNQLLALAAQGAHQRGMIADMIVGSGWPFGGEFLKEDETIQRIIINTVPLGRQKKINETKKSLLNKALDAQSKQFEEKALGNEVFFLTLIPKGIQDTSAVVDIMDHYDGDKLDYDLPEGNYDLKYGILQKGHREVMHGALGAAGPVMNHYEKEITLQYLGRLKKITEDTGIPLSELLRALFCDSIELAGANWTDGFEEIFFQTYGYQLAPYYPFVFYDPYQGYSEESYEEEFMDKIQRVRYDYNKLLVRVFLDNFTRVFQEFCTENGLKARYQAYGTPFLMGMMEGNMIADIPESNNWIYTADMEADAWNWNQNHGYMVWNLYAASGGHLTGRKIISSEAMTNLGGVFKASLAEIKQHDDMNFISGINHTVLHGYNYSPKEAGFPGWIRYGGYFSEKNTWWPYFSKWADYNARLSYVFQNSQPVKKIAVLGPTGDIWSEAGLVRQPFHTQPWYCYRLWESLSQAGSSSDYISEMIITEGDVSGGTLKYGPMNYEAIMLSSVESLEPRTAQALLKYVEQGGKLILIDEIPHRSLSLQDASANDILIQEAFAEMEEKYTSQIFTVKSPASEQELLSWTKELLDQTEIAPDVTLDDPDQYVFQIRKKHGEQDIYFFTNSHRTHTGKLHATFPVEGKTPWIWNPEDGTRKPFSDVQNGNALQITLEPLESMLLVFDTEEAPSENQMESHPGEVVSVIEGPWEVQFDHMNGESFSRTFDTLMAFGTASDEQLSTFAGTVTYTTAFQATGDETWLELGNVNKGVTEVFVNGKSAGTNWYGRPVFSLENVLQEGESQLEIKYTTVLGNYAKSLKDNPTAVRWSHYGNIPIGLEGKVSLYSHVGDGRK